MRRFDTIPLSRPRRSLLRLAGSMLQTVKNASQRGSGGRSLRDDSTTTATFTPEGGRWSLALRVIGSVGWSGATCGFGVSVPATCVLSAPATCVLSAPSPVATCASWKGYSFTQ